MRDRIIMVTEGSLQRGFGHIRRSATLAHELAKRTPVMFWLLDENRPDRIAPDVRKHLEGIIWSSGPEVPSVQDGVLILDLQHDIEGHESRMQIPEQQRVLALDWFNPSVLPDVTINLYDHGRLMRQAYALAGRVSDYHEGPAFAIIRPGLLALRQPAGTEVIKHVLITMGGADPARHSLHALQLFEHYIALDLEIVLVVGPFMPESYEQELRAAAFDGVTILRNPTDYDERIAAADLVVCSGGGTLLEAMAMGKASVVLPQTPAEEAHAEFHEACGACLFPRELPRVLADSAFRKDVAQKARDRVDGKGVLRIAEQAMELLHKGCAI